MALVNIINVVVLDNPTSFSNPFQFEVTFECTQALPDDLEWKVIYVGNANDSSGDQVLEEVMVGPVSVGINRFVLQANAPNPALIANQDLIGVTVILITCSFMDNKFVQIGYYVNNEYSEPFEPENFPNPVDINKLYRNILHDQPRVTRYAIDWSGETSGQNSLPVVPSSGDIAVEDDDDVLDLAQPADQDESMEDSEEDEESGDEEGEIDLEGEEDEDSGEEDEVEVDGDEDDGQESVSDSEMAGTGAGPGMRSGGYLGTMMGEDSNSMDVERMLQQ